MNYAVWDLHSEEGDARPNDSAGQLARAHYERCRRYLGTYYAPALPYRRSCTINPDDECGDFYPLYQNIRSVKSMFISKEILRHWRDGQTICSKYVAPRHRAASRMAEL